ncbi:hypothetical protein PG995_004105 [Apiospora arundinis]
MGSSSSPTGLAKPAQGSSPVPTGDAKLCYIYASSSGKGPADNTTVLASTSKADSFVASLNKDEVIILSGPPGPTASFDDSDETKKWFQQMDKGATLYLTVSDDPPPKDIKSFLVTLSEPWPITFSSAADVLSFTFGADLEDPLHPKARIQPPGINSTGNTLVCGLDFAKTKDITDTKLGDLFKYATGGLVANFPPKKLAELKVTLKNPGKSAKPRRNALWFTPGSDRRVDIRLQFQLSVFGPLQTLLGSALKGFTLTSADIIYRKTSLSAETEDGKTAPIASGSVVFDIECNVKGSATDGPQVNMAAGVEFSPSAISLTFMFTSANPLTGILRWLADLIGDSNLESFVTGILNKQESGSKVLADFFLRRLTIGLNMKDPENPKLSSFSFDIEVAANFGRSSTPNPVVFLISYQWDSFSGGFGTIGGQLWNDFTSASDWDLLPYEEIWSILEPVTQNPAKSLEIANLIPKQTILDIPDTLPSVIERAYISFSKDTFNIGGTVTAKEVKAGNVPQPYLGLVSLDASFSWGDSKYFTLAVKIDAGIQPSQGSPTNFLLFSGLYASTLVEFFDKDAKAHVGPLIKSICIDTLVVNYTYEPVQDGPDKGKSNTSTFEIKGALFIAQLRLDLHFKHDKDGFEFKATLNSKDKDTKIGDILSAVLGGDDIELPPFITDMKLVDNNKNVFTIEVAKKKTTVKDVEVVSFQFLAQLVIGKLHIDFAQLHSTEWGATAPSKRLIKGAVNGFPTAEVDIPLVGKLQQPLDELYFLWVQDPPDKSAKPQPNRQSGLTRKDIALLKTSLQDPLIVKDKFKTQSDKDILVPAGCHFAVIIHSDTGERLCLLDYPFMKPDDTKKQNSMAIAESSVPGKLAAPVEDDSGGESAQAPFKKKAGPLSIKNVGLKYKNKKLVIMFDATLAMGPVGFSLLGFSLEAEFETLDKLPKIDAKVEGLAAAFDKPPLTIAGIIRHGNTGGVDYYAGGLIVGFVPWQLQAAGFYGMVTPKDHPEKPFRSIFVFAKLDGPLITLEFAEISGVCGGFGYNSNVRLPAADEIYKFPFVASTDLGGADDVLATLEKLIDPSPAGWFQPLDSTYWLALGMKVDAFQMLSIDAVVVAQFGTGVKLGIFAVAVADIPTAKSPVKFAHVELGIAAVADLDFGTLKIEAQLSPRSYIFSEECHLTGGAALYYWFDAPQADRRNVGNFVFTLGGYHQAYVVPPGYPNPPRLGIQWSLGKNLSISGEAYFAITPKVCMGGGRLHAAFSAGPIEAWFDAFADFLINYKPFFFNAQAGISVGVRFNLDLLFIHTHISVEIGAQLYLWGPPLAGRVHVDFWITSFNIDFGKPANDDEKCTLYQFYKLVLQSDSSVSASSSPAMLTSGKKVAVAGEKNDPPVPKNEGHNFLALSGLLNPDEKTERPPNEPWIVRAGTFSFLIACKMAINSVKNDPDKGPIITYGKPEAGIDVFGKPMRLTKPMTSVLTVVVKQDGVSNPDEGWQYEQSIKSVPQGLWSKYNADTDPHGSGKKDVKDLLKGDPGGLPLMMGVQITAPKAHMSADPFPAFDVDDANIQRLRATRPFPTIAQADDRWAPGVPFMDKEVKQQFDAVYDGWTKPAMGTGDGGQRGFVGVLAQSLKWDNVAGLKAMAGIPERLAKGFMDLYVAAPLLTK